MIFPCAVYKSPGSQKGNHGLTYDALRCADKAAFDKAIASGWSEKLGEKPSKPAAEPEPTLKRAELEEEARKLGIKLDGRNSDERLAERIIEAMDAKTTEA